MAVVKYDFQYITTDVLTVKFIRKWIIAGIGECIHVFDAQTTNFVSKEKAFEEDRVHNIFDGGGKHLAVIGGKRINIFNFDENNDFRINSEASWAIDDWILFVQLLGDETIAIMTLHNVVSLWNFKTLMRMKNVCCEVKSILYCAALYGSSWSNLLAFGGTVFRQILVWIPSSNDDDDDDANRPVLHSLKGHDGVLFSVTYDDDAHLICSTSDDRSVRLWSVNLHDSESSNHLSQWKNAKITLSHTMYGHTARVWRNLITENNIISVGEDSLLFIWDHDGNLKKGWRTHQNGSVWSVDYSKERNLIVTGGSDGGICLWPLNDEEPIPVRFPFQDNLFEECCKSVKNKNEYFPRRIGLTCKGNIVAMTGSGYLLYCTIGNGTQGEWNIEYQDEKLENYCLLEMSPCRAYVALANIRGDIFIFNELDSSDEKHLILNVERKGVNGRIFSLHWLSSADLLTCGPDGILQTWHFGLPNYLEQSHEFVLPKSKERWVTAVSKNEKFLICGDRVGNIHLFRLDGSRNVSLQEPIQSLYKIHGHLGVSFLDLHGNHLYSTGRDGTLHNFLILESECKLKPLNADKLLMEWPAALSFSRYGLMILGFKSVDLLIWSQTERRILIRIPCGGGHRSWDWIMNDQMLTFIYLKDKMVHMITCRLDNIIKPVVQRGFHTKQIQCVRQVPFMEESCSYRLLISASEDTTVRVAAVDNSNKLQPLVVLQSHISSVRCLAVCSLEEGVLVFSGGGRAQLKVWKFVMENMQGDIPQIICEELLSHMLRVPDSRNRKPWLSMEPSNDPEARYMDLSALIIQPNEADKNPDLVILAAACSDGFLRILCFNAVHKELKVVGKYSFHNRCILKAFLTKTMKDKYVAFTMATDGKLALWDISVCVKEVLEMWNERNEASGAACSETTDEKLTPFATVKVHQSGINSFDWVKLDDETMLIATGGDDCALVLNTVRLISSDAEKITAEIVLKWRNDLAHVSQITGLKFMDNLLISTGVDQRITMWSWNYDVDNGAVSVDIKAKYISTVPDIQGLLTWNSSPNFTACVHGQGLEIINIHMENT